MCTISEKQISNLVSHGEKTNYSESSARAIAHIGQAVNIAVERFVAVGENIASDMPDLRDDIYRSCNQARSAGSTIEKLCEVAGENCLRDRGSITRAAKSLLTSITRVLLLADVVVVRQLLLVKDKVIRSLGKLEGITNFTEFVKAFSQFGSEMVELAHLTGDRHNDLKDERRRSQIAAARQVLERSTVLLLTSSKTCLRHPESSACRENRDTVFCQMRRAMDLIHFVVKDGVCDSDLSNDYDSDKTAAAAIRQFETLIDMTRLSLMSQPTSQDLLDALDVIIEQTQDFTDSAYTSHEYRENILILCNRVKEQLFQLLHVGEIPDEAEGYSPTQELECAVQNCSSAIKELKNQLILIATEHTEHLGTTLKSGLQLVTVLSNAALSCDEIRTQRNSHSFTQHIDHVVEICKLIRHITTSESLQVTARYTEINVKIYGPQVIIAAMTLAQYPESKIAKENMEVFSDMWQSLIRDVSIVCKEIMDSTKLTDKSTYMSLPRPGKHGTTSKPLKAVRLDVDEQEKIEKNNSEMKLAPTDIETDPEKWQDSTSNIDENNDIVKRARNMSRMAFSMYQFTKGLGSLKTTQDLFTQAEYFAEEANRLYKVIRQFSYQVPVGPHKKELLEKLDKIPTYVQQLQFTVKNPTVGKAATFNKVDSVIHETKNLMSIISKVVTTCFVCANKYTLDLQGVGWNGSGGSGGRDESGSRAGGDTSKSGSSSSSDPSI